MMRAMMRAIVALFLGACSSAHVPGLDAGAPLAECTPAADVCSRILSASERVGCSYDPNCPPFGLDLSACAAPIDAAGTCDEFLEAILLCRRCAGE